jgi:hypothetical protein
MNIGCNRLMMAVQAIFSQGDWLHSRRIEDTVSPHAFDAFFVD